MLPFTFVLKQHYASAFCHFNLPITEPNSLQSFFHRTSNNFIKFPHHHYLMTHHSTTTKSYFPLSKLHLSPSVNSAAFTVTKSAAVLPSSALKVTKLTSLLPHQDTFYVLSSIFALSSFGIILEKRTTIGKALSVCSKKASNSISGYILTLLRFLLLRSFWSMILFLILLSIYRHH